MTRPFCWLIQMRSKNCESRYPGTRSRRSYKRVSN
jgi:hypothetical protein